MPTVAEKLALVYQLRAAFARKGFGPPAREHYKQDGQWITIGGGSGPDGQQHAGGTPVQIDESGNIQKGPAALKGKPLGQKKMFGHDELNKAKAQPDLFEVGEKLPKHKPKPAAPSGPIAAEPAKPAEPEKRDTPIGVHKTPDGRWIGATQLHVSELQADPSRFQYKIHGIDPVTGVTKQFTDIKQYNPVFGGQILAWRDPKDGKNYVINGHHRYEIAKRSPYKEKQGPYSPGWSGELNVMFIDAETPAEARAIGAMTNIAEGNGSSIDAAKFLRDSKMTAEEMRAAGISLKGKIAHEGNLLSKMSDGSFSRLAQGLIREGTAVAVLEELADDPERADKMFHDVAEKERNTGKAIPDQWVREAARRRAMTPKVKAQKKDGDLFDFDDEDDVWMEVAQLSTLARKSFHDDSAAFKHGKREKTAGRLEAVGNVIDTERNAQEHQRATAWEMIYDQQINLRGELSQAVGLAALKMRNSTSASERKQIERDFTKTAYRIVSGLAGGGESGGLRGVAAAQPETPEIPDQGPHAGTGQIHGQTAESGSRERFSRQSGAQAVTTNPLTAMFQAAFDKKPVEYYQAGGIVDDRTPEQRAECEHYARQVEEYSRVPSVKGVAASWDEAKHPRDHGKFSSTPGAKGEAKGPAAPKGGALRALEPKKPSKLQNIGNEIKTLAGAAKDFFSPKPKIPVGPVRKDMDDADRRYEQMRSAFHDKPAAAENPGMQPGEMKTLAGAIGGKPGGNAPAASAAGSGLGAAAGAVLDKGFGRDPSQDTPAAPAGPAPSGADRHEAAIEAAKARENAAFASSALFAPHERSLPQWVSQTANTPEALYAQAPAAKESFDSGLNHGQGVDKAIGANVMRPSSAEEFNAALNSPGNTVILAGMKGELRATEKVVGSFKHDPNGQKSQILQDVGNAYKVKSADGTVAFMRKAEGQPAFQPGQEVTTSFTPGKYGGDWTKLTDVVRATVAVESKGDIPGAMHAVRREMEQKGWTMATAPDNRMEKPTPAGYRDINILWKNAEGHVAELQINTKSMIRAKEGQGHKLYEEYRTLAENPQIGPEHQQRMTQLEHQMAALYSEAWR